MGADTSPARNARRSLDGLSVGDAFGQLHFTSSPRQIAARLPDGPWPWTDDTHMALSVVETLLSRDCIDPDHLSRAFARRFAAEPHRGYARGAMHLLAAIGAGGDWRVLSPALFGTGSYGNGAAMRAAPIGAYFAGAPERASAEARVSAVVTHAHHEGQAGAIAVAVAASLASMSEAPTGRAFITEVASHVPAGLTRSKLVDAADIPKDELGHAIRTLGTGARVSAQDTVPFCVWVAGHHLTDFAGALFRTASGMGDVDTTCAIVGGIVAMSATDIPADWVARREPLPIVAGVDRTS